VPPGTCLSSFINSIITYSLGKPPAQVMVMSFPRLTFSAEGMILVNNGGAGTARISKEISPSKVFN
jgi:hypothetical protein